MQTALQLYSLREMMASDFIGTVKAAAGVGYKAVEFAGFGGLSAEEMNKLLSETGLVPAGAHIGIDALRKDLQATVSYAAAIGLKTAVCPGINADSYEGWVAAGKELNGYAQAFKKVGIPFGYHNHAHEFKIFNGKYALDILFENAPDVFPELDLHWVSVGGEDPIGYTAKYGSRIKALHAKDINAEGKEVEVGTGIIDFAGCAKAAPNCEWFIIEHEVYNYPVLESVKIGLDNLSKAIKA